MFLSRLTHLKVINNLGWQGVKSKPTPKSGITKIKSFVVERICSPCRFLYSNIFCEIHILPRII